MDKAQELKQLIAQICGNNKTSTLHAVQTLRDRGWLTDGSLYDVNLSGVDLSGTDLSNIKLKKANLKEANLSGANLSKAYLPTVNLTRANLKKANLSEATLYLNRPFDLDVEVYGFIVDQVPMSQYRYWAESEGADLDVHGYGQTNLIEADLSEANLSDADLREVDLSGADLSRAYLCRTRLGEAILKNAFCGKTAFLGVDLSTVKRLDTVKHRELSFIDIHTFYQSHGGIPKEFLRGCGIPENFIISGPPLIEKAIEFYSCFISYSYSDKSFAQRLHDTLQSMGIRCWLDDKQINPGDDIYEEIDRGIRNWDKVLLCCSKSALAEKWWVDLEINKAFQKERELTKKRQKKVLVLIPLDLDGYLFEGYIGPKKDEICSRSAASFKGWEHDNAIFEYEMEKVIKALRIDRGKELPPEPKL